MALLNITLLNLITTMTMSRKEINAINDSMIEIMKKNLC